MFLYMALRLPFWLLRRFRVVWMGTCLWLDLPWTQIVDHALTHFSYFQVVFTCFSHEFTVSIHDSY